MLDHAVFSAAAVFLGDSFLPAGDVFLVAPSRLNLSCDLVPPASSPSCCLGVRTSTSSQRHSSPRLLATRLPALRSRSCHVRALLVGYGPEEAPMAEQKREKE
ncbi:unnamed protein product [Miscanthus lutarioriparius]|uniref:Uncharacterized protein n=1 Tax=Miscanthus lutarioriparius TaxID=422564 RepID=A0A811PAE1_9POAL|nr:unnamed protein product [Miscanthus lutarioriparius]